jgi:uncharacterized membrane protein YphA (DoxX/SURF4 family)
LIAVFVLGVLLAVTWVGAGVPKALGRGPAIREAHTVAMTIPAMRGVGVCEILGGLGVAIGLRYPPLGVLAAACLVALMVGALQRHLQAHDPLNRVANPIIMGGLMIVWIVLRLRSG